MIRWHQLCAHVSDVRQRGAFSILTLKWLDSTAGSRNESSSDFQTIRPVPNVLRWNRWIFSLWRLAKQRCWRLETSESGMQHYYHWKCWKISWHLVDFREKFVEWNDHNGKIVASSPVLLIGQCSNLEMTQLRLVLICSLWDIYTVGTYTWIAFE